MNDSTKILSSATGTIVDRRGSKGKSTVNRGRFLDRYKKLIAEQVKKASSGRSITDKSGQEVRIPTRSIREPTFRNTPGVGEHEVVTPGNKDYVKGDRFKRPESGKGKGQGKEASNEGEGEDDFAFSLSHDEWLQYIFDDLALPNLVKEFLSLSNETKFVRSGFATEGIQANMHVLRTMRQSIGRRIALAAPLRIELLELEEELAALREDVEDRRIEIKVLEEKIHVLKSRLLRIPFLDTFDLRYSNRVAQPKPANKAVMFCLMDVSGSMDEEKKDMAKNFFRLLYLFLNRIYTEIEVVFICHRVEAEEVSEEDFFYSRKTGGTVVSSALLLMQKIIEARYSPEEWNIYGAQASDGDNWQDDSAKCVMLLDEHIMPLVQYFAYIEIADRPQDLWNEYKYVKLLHPFFAMERIRSHKDIFPVFRELFKKEGAPHE